MTCPIGKSQSLYVSFLTNVETSLPLLRKICWMLVIFERENSVRCCCGLVRLETRCRPKKQKMYTVYKGIPGSLLPLHDCIYYFFVCAVDLNIIPATCLMCLSLFPFPINSVSLLLVSLEQLMMS